MGTLFVQQGNLMDRSLDLPWTEDEFIKVNNPRKGLGLGQEPSQLCERWLPHEGALWLGLGQASMNGYGLGQAHPFMPAWPLLHVFC